MACPEQLYIEDSGDTVIDGVNSMFTVRWQTIGYQSNTTRKAAIINHPDYLDQVTTTDGQLLNVQRWTYENQVGDKKIVQIDYRHQEGSGTRGNSALQDVGDEEERISFTTRTQPFHWAYSQDAYPTTVPPDPDNDAPLVGNAIEFNEATMEHRGTTREQTIVELNVTRIYDDATITQAWLDQREAQLWTWNETEFRSREAKTVLFVGLDLQQQIRIKDEVGIWEGPWHVTFGFRAARKELINISRMGLGDIPVTVFPWQYTWVYYKSRGPDAAGYATPKAKGFYVAEIYTSSEHNDIIT